MLKSIEDVEVGDKVHYQPQHYPINKFKNGIVKEIREREKGYVWVVYDCAEDWENYDKYTSAKTRLSDLFIGWG